MTCVSLAQETCSVKPIPSPPSLPLIPSVSLRNKKAASDIVIAKLYLYFPTGLNWQPEKAWYTRRIRFCSYSCLILFCPRNGLIFMEDGWRWAGKCIVDYQAITALGHGVLKKIYFLCRICLPGLLLMNWTPQDLWVLRLEEAPQTDKER